jgi:hypothetical protein
VSPCGPGIGQLRDSGRPRIDELEEGSHLRWLLRQSQIGFQRLYFLEQARTLLRAAPNILACSSVLSLQLGEHSIGMLREAALA